MTTKLDLNFRAGENWRITFVAHNEDDSIMTLDGGAIVKFRLVGIFDDDDEPTIEKTTSDGITITDASGGAARIDVSVDDQTDASVGPETAYGYEIIVLKGAETTVQAEGRFIVEASLFGPQVSLLLRMFRVRFPEITNDSAQVMLTINEALRTINSENCWNTLDIDNGALYLAAHNLLQHKSAAIQFESGGIESGPIRTISVEGRTVSYGNASGGASQSSGPKVGYAQTDYGKMFRALSMRQVRSVLRG